MVILGTVLRAVYACHRIFVGAKDEQPRPGDTVLCMHHAYAMAIVQHNKADILIIYFLLIAYSRALVRFFNRVGAGWVRESVPTQYVRGSFLFAAGGRRANLSCAEMVQPSSAAIFFM